MVGPLWIVESAKESDGVEVHSSLATRSTASTARSGRREVDSRSCAQASANRVTGSSSSSDPENE